MDNAVFFDVRLNWSSVKSGLQGMAGSAKSHFTSIDNLIGQTQNSLNSLGRVSRLNIDSSSIDIAGRKVDELGRKIRRVGSEGSNGGRGGNGLGFFGTSGAMMLGGLGIGAAMAGIEKTIEAGKSMLESGIKVQNMKVGLSTFVGDKKADFIVDDIMKSSAKTPYTTSALLPGIRGIMAAGYDYGRAKKDVWAIANAVAATGGTDYDMERVQRDMQKGAAKGVVDGRVLNELYTAGIPIGALLKKEIPGMSKLSNSMATEKIENMTLSYDMIAGALDKASKSGGMFAGAMEKLSQTIGGKWSTIKDYWQMGGAKLTESQNTAIIKLEDMAIHAMEKMPALIENITPTVTRLFEKVDELLPTIAKFGGALGDVLKPLGEFAMSDEFTQFLKGVGDLAEASGKAAKWILEHGPKQIAEGAAALTGGAFTGIGDFYNLLFDMPAFDKKFDPRMVANRDTMYAWEKPLGANGTIDSVAMKHTEDSLGRGENKFYPSVKAGQDSVSKLNELFYKRTWTEFVKLPLPFSEKKAADKAKRENEAGIESESDKVIGGGKKITNLNFHAPLIKIDHQAFSDGKAGVQIMEPLLKEMIGRILVGIPG